MLKKILIWIIGLFIPATFAATVPVVPMQMKWVHTYETLLFDTPSGDLEFGYYALDEDGDEYYVRTVPEDEGQFGNVFVKDFNVRGKKEAHVIGKAYYHEFFDGKRIHRVRADAEIYNALRFKEKTPHPERVGKRPILSPIRVDADIAFDASAVSTFCSNCTGDTWSHTSTGDDLLMFIAPACADNDSGNYDADTVTYNGVAATRQEIVFGASNNDHIEAWYLANPATGSNTVSISDASFSCDQLLGLSVTYTGTDTTDPIDTSTTGSDTGSSNPSTDITTTADNTWVIDFVAGHATFATLTVDGSQTARHDVEWGNGNRTGISDEPAASTGTYSMDWTLSSHWQQIVVSFNQKGAVDIATATSTATDDSSTTMHGEIIGFGAASSADVGFEYGIDSGTTGTFTSTTTTLTATTSIGTYSESVGSLTTFEEYGFRAFASSTVSAANAFSYGETYQFFTADISTSTPVVQADLHEWDYSLFTDGTHNDTTGTTALTLTDAGGGGVATTTSSFESCTDGSTTFTGETLWTQASITADGGDWQCETGATGSANTGADDGSAGTVFIYTEASSGGSCDNVTAGGTDCAIEANIADNVTGAVAFDYSMDGAHLGTLSLDGYDGSSWTTIWSVTGDQGTGGGYASTYQTFSDTDGYTHLRFLHDVGGAGFEADASLDNIRVGTSSPSYIEGFWVSPSWDMGSITSVDDSWIEWASTTVSGAEVTVKTAVNTSATVPPSTSSDYATSTPQSTIPGISASDDLTGKYLWIRVEMRPNADNSQAPSLTQLIVGINQGVAGPALPTPPAGQLRIKDGTLRIKDGNLRIK